MQHCLSSFLDLDDLDNDAISVAVDLEVASNPLRAVCCKDQLRSCNIEKTDFPKLCQNEGLG